MKPIRILVFLLMLTPVVHAQQLRVVAEEDVYDLVNPNNGAGHYFLAVGLPATNHAKEARESLSRATAFGHSPQPDFLKALGIAEEQLEKQRDPSIVTSIGAGAPKDSNRRK